MSHNAKAWKFKRALLQLEELCRAKTLWNVKFLWGLLSDKTKTSEGRVTFNFRIWLRHMKTENKNVLFRDTTWRFDNYISNCLSMIWKFASWMNKIIPLPFFHKLITLFHSSLAGKKRAYLPLHAFEKKMVSCYKLCEKNKSIKLQMLALKK